MGRQGGLRLIVGKKAREIKGVLGLNTSKHCKERESINRGKNGSQVNLGNDRGQKIKESYCRGEGCRKGAVEDLSQKRMYIKKNKSRNLGGPPINMGNRGNDCPKREGKEGPGEGKDIGREEGDQLSPRRSGNIGRRGPFIWVSSSRKEGEEKIHKGGMKRSQNFTVWGEAE